MTFAVDYTREIAVNALKTSGVSQVFRYLSWLPNPKVIGELEYLALVNAGIGVVLNWEYDSHDWLSGATGGTSHGREAVRQARLLGYPTGSVIIGSADFDMTLSQWNSSGRSYATAFAKAITDGGYRPGVYGPWDVLTWCTGLMAAFWQAGMSTAWSGGRNRNLHPSAGWRQVGHVTIAGQDCDRNEILHTVPLVTTKGTDKVAMLAVDANGQYYVCDGIVSRPIKDIGDFVYLARQGLCTLAPVGGTAVEWEASTGARRGWSADAFGALPATTVSLTDAQLSALASKLAALSDPTTIANVLKDVLKKGVDS